MKHLNLLKTTLLLFALVVGSTSLWAQGEPGLNDFTWPTPIVDEDFTNVATVSANTTAASLTNITKHGAFNGLYNNKTENTYGIENTKFSSNALFLTSGNTTSPIVIGISNITFGNAGAFSFKCKKANYGYIGMSGDGINGTPYTKAKASCYMQINNGVISISNGTSWKEVTTATTTDVNICIIYNNTKEDLVYGNAIALASLTAHVYVNGECVMNGSKPKAMAIEDSDISSFRIVTCQKNATMNVDDVKIYNELPGYKVPATISTAKYATFVSPYATDFSTTGVTVYTATAGETSVTLNEVASGKVPANTPVVLYKAGADGTAINVPVIASADAVGSNDLKVSDGTNPGSNTYVLANKTHGVGFYKWAGGSLTSGKIYLQGASSAREFLGFGDVTGIENLTPALSQGEGAWYDLQGRRVAQPTKGLYIVNGRKVVIK